MRGRIVIKTEFFRLKGYIKAHSIRAKHIIINGFAEVLGSITAEKAIIIGGLKTHSITCDIITLNASSPTVILDLKARIARIASRKRGRVHCNNISADITYLKRVHVDSLDSKVAVIDEGTVIGKIVTNRNVLLKIKSPYCSFRTDPMGDSNRKIKIVFGY